MRRTLAESRASFVGFVPTASLASCKASTAAFNEERAPLGRRDLVSIIETKGGGERERGGVNLLAGVRFPARYLMKCGNISIPPFPLAPFPQRFFQMTVLVSGRNKHTVSRSSRGPRHGYLHMDGDQGFRNPAAAGVWAVAYLSLRPSRSPTRGWPFRACLSGLRSSSRVPLPVLQNHFR